MISKTKCLRCGYSEFKGSLHIHHKDHNHDNNEINNLIVLCGNCHFGLHHGKWKLEDVGINDYRVNKKKRLTKKPIVIKKIDLLNRIHDLESSINNLTHEILKVYSKIRDLKHIHNNEINRIQLDLEFVQMEYGDYKIMMEKKIKKLKNTK